MVNLLSAIFMQYLNLTFSFIYMYTPIKAPKITFLCYSYCKARFWIELQVEQCVNLNMNRTSSASFIVFFFFFPLHKQNDCVTYSICAKQFKVLDKLLYNGTCAKDKHKSVLSFQIGCGVLQVRRKDKLLLHVVLSLPLKRCEIHETEIMSSLFRVLSFPLFWRSQHT